MGSPSSPRAPVVVYVQDVHGNAEAQRNIGALVRNLVAERKANLLALEGTWGEIPLARFRNFHDPQAVQQAADFLLKENKISGPIQGVLAGKGPFPRVVGIDDPSHYNANVEAYRESAPRVERYQEILQRERASLEALKGRAYSRALWEFDQEVGKYVRGEMSLGDYARLLLSRNPSGVSSSLRAFSMALEMERALDFRQVEVERSQLLERLVPRLTPEQEKRLLSISMSYRAGEMSYGDFYSLLSAFCGDTGLALSSFPSMDRYVRYVLLSEQIDGEALFNNIPSIEKDLYGALAHTPEERGLVARSRHLDLTQKLISFALTPGDWAEYQTTHAGLSTGLSAGNLRSFEQFYEEAHVRDRQMAKNLQAFLLKDTEVALLVTGGYHAAGVTDQLTAAGMTVISFVPRIEKADTIQGSNSLSVFTQEKSPLEKLFPGEKLFLAKNPADPSVMKMLLPSLVVAVSLWGGNLWGKVDPHLLYAGLGGVGVLSVIRIIRNRAQFRISWGSAQVDLSVEMGKKGIQHIQEELRTGRGAGYLRKGLESVVGGLGGVRNRYLPWTHAFDRPGLRTLLGFAPIIAIGVFVAVGLTFGMAMDPNDIHVWGSVLFAPLSLGSEKGGLRPALQPPEVVAGKKVDFRKLDALYKDMAKLEFNLNEGGPSASTNTDLVAKANNLIEFNNRVGEIIRKSGELSPEFKSIFDESSSLSPADIPGLFETISRFIFISAGRCLPRSLKSFKNPLVINPSSWKRMHYLGHPIWIATVSPYGELRSRLEDLTVVAPVGFVFVNDLNHEKARTMFKLIKENIQQSGGNIRSPRLSRSKITERDLDGGIKDWALRLELSKTKDALYTANINDAGIADVTPHGILTAILRPGGPAQKKLLEALHHGMRVGQEVAGEDPSAIYLSYAEFLESFYEHLLPFQGENPDKAFVLGTLTLAEIMADSLGHLPRELGARLLVDQIREKLGMAEPMTLFKVTQSFSGESSLFAVIKEIRNENLFLPEERFFSLNQRAPTQAELDQLYSIGWGAGPAKGGTMPLSAATRRNHLQISTPAARLLNRFDASERTSPEDSYSPEVKEIVKRFKTLSDRFSSPENTGVSQAVFASFLRELTGGDNPAQGFRHQAGQRPNIEIVQTCATLLEDLLREVGTRVFEQSLKDGQEFLELGDFQGAIRLLLDLKGQGLLLDTIPQEAGTHLERLLESVRYLFLHDSRQPALPLSEIIAKADLLGLDEAEVNALQAHQNHPESDERRRGDDENLTGIPRLARGYHRQGLEQNFLASPDGNAQSNEFFGLNAWGVALLCARLGKHVPANLVKLKREMQAKEEDQKTGDVEEALPLTLRGGYRVFLSNEVQKSQLWIQHQREILLKLDRFLAEGLEDQIHGNKEKLDVTVGGLLLGADLPHVLRNYLPAARFYFRVFEEKDSAGGIRKSIYLIAIENKGDSSENGGRGKLSETLKNRLRKVSLASGSGNMAVFRKYAPLLLREIPGKGTGAMDGGVAMHAVGGHLFNSFQLGFLQKRAKTIAPVEMRQAWADQIDGKLYNPNYRGSLRPMGLIPPVKRLLVLLRSENPTVTMGGVERPVQIKLLSGSSENFFPGMPRAYGTIAGEGGSHGIEMGVFPEDLAAVLHEGLEIVLREDSFVMDYAENPHTYAFLGEVLANGEKDGFLVPKRALVELGRKNADELMGFLKNGRRNLIEIDRKFGHPNQYAVRARLIEINQALTHYALMMVRERVENNSTLFHRKVRELEKLFAMGLMDEAALMIEDLQRLLFHWERARGPLPLLAKYVKERQAIYLGIQSGFGETERILAQGISELLGILEEYFYKQEFGPLLTGIKKVQELRSALPAVLNQLPLFGLWENIGDVMNPLFEAGDWNEADKRFERFIEFGIKNLNAGGVSNQYLERLFYDFLGFYRAQRDLGQGNELEMMHFSETVRFLNAVALKMAVTDADRRKLNRTLFETDFRSSDFEMVILGEILARLRVRLRPLPLFQPPKPNSAFVPKRYSPVLARILSKYPSLPASPEEISQILSRYASHDLTVRQAMVPLVKWGIAKNDAQLYLMDVAELSLGSGFVHNSQSGRSSVALLGGVAGLLSIGLFFPLILGNVPLGLGVIPVLGAWAFPFGLPIVMGLAGIPRLARGHRRQWFEQKSSDLVDGKMRPTEFFGLGFVGDMGSRFVHLHWRVSSSQEKKSEIVQGILSILQERPISLGVNGRSLIESASGYGGDRDFRETLHDQLRQGGIALSFAQARRLLFFGFSAGRHMTSAGQSSPVGGGEKPLTIVYLDEDMAAAEKSVSSIIQHYSSGVLSGIVVVPIDKKAWEAARLLAHQRGVWIVDHLPPGGGDDVSSGPWYRLANVEQHLSSLGVQLSEYTGCRIVAPLRLDIGVDGIKSDLFREALVILLDGLIPRRLKRSDLSHIDRLARAVASAA